MVRLSQPAADSLQSDPELKELLPLTKEAFAAMHYPAFETVDFANIADRFNREVAASSR